MALPKMPFIQWREQPDRTCRPRFAPSSRELALGFPGCDLRHPNGAWFTFEEVREWLYGRDGKSGKYSEILQARRGKKPKKTANSRSRATVADLLEDWQRSDEFKKLRPASRRSYIKCIRAILYQPQSRADAAAMRAKIKAAELLGQSPPARDMETIATVTPTSIGKPELRAFFNYLVRERGQHMAIATIATLSAAWSWGQESTHWRLPTNPRDGMEFARPEGRVVLVEIHEFMAWVAACDAIGKASVGDSQYLALFTGQRQTDRLAMRDESEATGRHAFKQSKTGELVDIKEAPQLAARLDAARTRVAELKLKFGLREMPPEIVINEETGAPYDENTYRHWVSTARDVAVFGWLARMDRQHAINRALQLASDLRQTVAKFEAKHPLSDDDETAKNRAIAARSRALQDWFDQIAIRDSNGDRSAWKLAPCPSLYFINRRGELDAKHDQDLRDTCVMLLDRAGCDLLTICDITGHSYKSAQTIVKHYRARNAARADEGIDRLVLQVRKEGMTG